MNLTTWRERLGPIGVWAPTDALGLDRAVALARQVEALGYGGLWVPETMGRDPFAHLTHLATQTTDLVLATGIANIHHRLPGVTLQAANTVAEVSGGRFVLGIGVSHRPLVEGLRHVAYGRPLEVMGKYLTAMDTSPYMAPAPPEAPPRLLAALGPRMLELAATRADGAHTYLVTPEHTATARGALGPDKLLCVEQKVVLTDDADLARSTAAGAVALYVGLPNYVNNWLRLGFSAQEISDRAPRFLDAVVAWGSPERLLERITQHQAAGADHVCIQALTPGQPLQPDSAALEALAPA